MTWMTWMVLMAWMAWMALMALMILMILMILMLLVAQLRPLGWIRSTEEQQEKGHRKGHRRRGGRKGRREGRREGGRERRRGKAWGRVCMPARCERVPARPAAWVVCAGGGPTRKAVGVWLGQGLRQGLQTLSRGGGARGGGAGRMEASTEDD